MKTQLIKWGKYQYDMLLYICIVHIQTKERSQSCSNCYMTDLLEFGTLMNTPEWAVWAEQGTERLSPVASEGYWTPAA